MNIKNSKTENEELFKPSWVELKNYALFAEIPDSDLKDLASEMILKNYDKGEIIFEEEDKAEYFFVILSGSVLILRKNVQIAQLESGDYLGEMSLLQDQIRSATVKAESDTVVLEFKVDGFKKYITKNPKSLLVISKNFNERLKRHNDLVVSQYLDIQNKFEELKKNQEQMLQMEKMASIGILSAGIAHEVKNPLSITIGMMTLLKEKMIELNINDKEIFDYFEIHDKASKNIENIVNAIRAYAREGSDKFELFDLQKVVEETICLIHYVYLKEGITLKTVYSVQKSLVKGNRDKFQQALMNLLSNAKDAMENVENPVIKIETSNEGKNIVTSVSDNGHGIKKEDEVKIFKKFHTTKPVGKGTGLGLELSKSFITEMNGDITFNSKLGIGTTFSIKLPLN